MTANVSSPLTIGTCRDCGYALFGLPENRCPECGRAFDPADPRTSCSD
jgi:rubrerythrin